MKKILAGLFFGAAVIGIFGCNNGVDYEKMRREELTILKDYIDQVHPDAEATASGLYYFNEEGTGNLEDTIKLGDNVQVFYATWVLISAQDSFLVDQTSGYLEGHRYEPLSFTVGNRDVVTGLDEAIQYMYPGTRSHLVINSELAYGQNGSGTVGMFQTILMEVEVYKVTHAATTTP